MKRILGIFLTVIFVSVSWAASAGAVAFIYELKSDISCNLDLGGLEPNAVSLHLVIPDGSAPIQSPSIINWTVYEADLSESWIAFEAAGGTHTYSLNYADVELYDGSPYPSDPNDGVGFSADFTVGSESYNYLPHLGLNGEDYYTLYPSAQSSFDTNDVVKAWQSFNAIHYDNGERVYDGNLCRDGDIMSEISRASANPVPEPTTMLLFGAGLVGLAGFGRKKFKK